MKDLKGKVAAVTGAASGLGRSMALAFAGEGMDVALADVDEVNLSSVQEEVLAKGVRAITRWPGSAPSTSCATTRACLRSARRGRTRPPTGSGSSA